MCAAKTTPPGLLPSLVGKTKLPCIDVFLVRLSILPQSIGMKEKQQNRGRKLVAKILKMHWQMVTS